MGYKLWLCLIFSLDKYSIIYIINNFNSIWEVSFGKVFKLINKRGGFMSRILNFYIFFYILNVSLELD